MSKTFDPQKYWEDRWARNESHDTASLSRLYAEINAGPPYRSKNHGIRAGHLEWLKTALEPHSGKTLLDAGCGPGFWFPLWQELGLQAKAVDRTELGVSNARATSDAVGADIPVSLAELSTLPFEDKSFDIAVTVMVLLHTPPSNIRETLRELGRVSDTILLLEHNYPPNATLSPHVFDHDYKGLAQELGHEILSETRRPMEFGHESLFLIRSAG